ncbi:MAG: sugar phosphate isomerase/epimerase family protein [Armatimonadota bacterium]|jgi:sugar phosphate isomerase/epimerase
MRISFIVRPGDNRREAAVFAAGEGLDGLELMYHSPEESDFDDAEEVIALCDQYQVRVSAVGVWHVGLADPLEAGTREVILAGLKYAGRVGADCFFTGAGEPDGDDQIGALAEAWPHWEDLALAEAMDLAVYLGHKGSFLCSEAQVAAAVERVEGLGLKLDPVGLIRNLSVEPRDFLHRFGASCAFFHAKDRLVLAEGEIEPPPGMGELHWGQMLAILQQHGYDGWVSIEPHGRHWNAPENRWRYVRLAARHLRQFFA